MGVKQCAVALTLATTPAPVRNLSPSWMVSLSVATSFHTTSVGGTVSELYMCKSVDPPFEVSGTGDDTITSSLWGVILSQHFFPGGKGGRLQGEFSQGKLLF